MKKIFTLALLCVSAISFSQSFSPVEYNAFNPSLGSTVTNCLTSFKGQIYAGVGNPTGQLFKSSTGDGGDFASAFSDNSSYLVSELDTTADGGGYITAVFKYYNNTGHGDRLYMSPDGTNWSLAYESPVNTEIKSVNFYKGSGTVDSIYISVYDGFSSFIKCSSINGGAPTNWNLVLDINTFFADGTIVEHSFVYQGRLYLSMNSGKLYETTDGITYSENTNYSATVGPSSVAQNNYITCSATVGSTLYFGTRNSLNNARVYYTNDGLSFTQSNAFIGFTQVRKIIAENANLYCFVTDNTTNYDLWKNVGGTYTVQDISSYKTLQTGILNGCDLLLFNNHLYTGITSSFGGQLHRRCEGVSPNVALVNDTLTVCPTTNATFNVTGNANSYVWNSIDASSFNGTTGASFTSSITGRYWVTGIATNGCRVSRLADLKNYFTQNIYFTKENDNVQSTYTNYCKGDTSKIYVAHGENEYPALKVPNINAGVDIPSNSDMTSFSPCTFELWAKPTSAGVILSEYDVNGNWSENNSAIIWIDQNLTVYGTIPGSGGVTVFLGNLINNLTQWHHFAVTCDGTNFTGYLDGVFMGNAIGNRFAPPVGDAYKIGKDVILPSTMNGFIGQVRNLRIWTTERTASEIYTNLYNDTLSANNFGLLYNYRFDEGTGILSTAYDNSVNQADISSVGSSALIPATLINFTPAPGLISLGNNRFKFASQEFASYDYNYTNSNGCYFSTNFTSEPYYLDIDAVPPCGVTTASGSVKSTNVWPISNGEFVWTSPSIGSIVDNQNINYVPNSPEYLVATLTSIPGCVLRDSGYVTMGGPKFACFPGPQRDIYSINACENDTVLLNLNLEYPGTPPYTIMWGYFTTVGVDHAVVIDTTTTTSYTFMMGNQDTAVVTMGIDASGCPLEFADGFLLTKVPSTDLLVRVTSQASLPVNPGEIQVFKYAPATATSDSLGGFPLDANGESLFTGLNSGKFLVKAIPNSTSYPNSVDTYYGNAYQWDSALVYSHGCSQVDTVNIQVIDVLGNMGGTGLVEGYIYEDPGFGARMAPGDPIPGVGVNLGRKPGGASQLRTTTDANGQFSFTNVPDGDYWIFADIPNMPQDSTRSVTISPTNQVSTNNDYWVDSTTIYVESVNVGLIEVNQTQSNSVIVYPNPIQDNFNVQFTMDKNETVKIEIYNTLGALVFNKTANAQYGSNNINISDAIGVLSKGSYQIKIIANQKTLSQRFVLTK